MRRLLPILARTSPQIGRKVVLPGMLTLNLLYFEGLPRLRCVNDPFMLSENISAIENCVIKVKSNGDLVEDAFCFAENYLVAVSYELLEINPNVQKKTYEFYMAGQHLQGSFNVIGHFENLTFFEHTSSTKIEPLPSDDKQSSRIFPVQIFKKGEYARLKNGYYVAKDSGYGIVDGKGEIGSLVIKNGKAAGIVTQIGRDLESGILRIIEWTDLPKILSYLKGERKRQLGISAQAHEFSEGISVVRISPNSLLKDEMLMGDTILRANNQKIREVTALQRITILADGHLTLDILREEVPMQIRIEL